MYKAIDLAKYIVSKCISDDCPISNLTLQKILFYIQKNFLSRNKLAFCDDIEAWAFGPAIPNVYYHYCNHGVMEIFLNPGDDAVTLDEDKNIIDKIIEIKRELPVWETANEINRQGGAWDIVYDNGNGNHKIISVNLIKTKG